jgi:ectoine hydroxylase-related dioxygenase (phytanoyl-CoA dioxygenase family)
MDTTVGLTTGQQEAFWRDGYVVIEDVLDAGLLDALRTSLEERLLPRARAEAAANADFQIEPGATMDSVRVIWNPARYDDVWWRLMKHPTLVGAARDILGDRARLFGSGVFMKPPFEGSAKEWHQDLEQGFLPPDEKERILALGPQHRDVHTPLIIAQVYLDDATAENGCLEFVPGSHRWGMFAASQTEQAVARGPIVPAPVRAGGAAVFHGLTYHYSAPNRSDKPRRAPLVRYFVPDTATCRFNDFTESFFAWNTPLD